MREKDVLDEFVIFTAMGWSETIENRIRILVKPKPRWVPQSVWYWVVARVLVMGRES